MIVQNKIKILISLIIANTEDYLPDDMIPEEFYTQGACYILYKIVKEYMPEVKPYISNKYDHVVIEYEGNLYDVNGIVPDSNNYREMNEIDIKYSEEYSLDYIKYIDYILKDIDNIQYNSFVFERKLKKEMNN